MTHYGRPAGKESVPPAHRDVQKAADRVLALGCALLAAFLIVMTVPWRTVRADSAFPEGYMPTEGVTAVMNTVTEIREDLTRPENVEPYDVSDTGAEPFGYLNGTWNLWEYIGDVMWSLLS